MKRMLFITLCFATQLAFSQLPNITINDFSGSYTDSNGEASAETFKYGEIEFEKDSNFSMFKQAGVFSGHCPAANSMPVLTAKIQRMIILLIVAESATGCDQSQTARPSITGHSSCGVPWLSSACQRQSQRRKMRGQDRTSVRLKRKIGLQNIICRPAFRKYFVCLRSKVTLREMVKKRP